MENEEKKHTGTFIEIDKLLYKEIKLYTNANNLSPTKFINQLLRKAFMIEKYGEIPACLIPKEKPVIAEVRPSEENTEQDKKIEQAPEEPKSPIKGKKIITY